MSRRQEQEAARQYAALLGQVAQQHAWAAGYLDRLRDEALGLLGTSSTADEAWSILTLRIRTQYGLTAQVQNFAAGMLAAAAIRLAWMEAQQ